jgi:tRNA pseudouridine38-40 synthase
VAELERALNAVLPPDVAMGDLEAAAEGWHPRFSATRRSYRYSVLCQPVRSPLDRRYAHHVARPLDLALLQRAAEEIVGVRDFASFGRPTQGDSTVREVFGARWQQNGPWLIFDIEGNAFLRGMVRCLVGSLLMVGEGSWPPERVSQVLESRDRGLAAPPAPACGLCLMKVEY